MLSLCGAPRGEEREDAAAAAGFGAAEGCDSDNEDAAGTEEEEGPLSEVEFEEIEP